MSFTLPASIYKGGVEPLVEDYLTNFVNLYRERESDYDYFRSWTTVFLDFLSTEQVADYVRANFSWYLREVSHPPRLFPENYMTFALLWP